jgi:hypothetical protein
MSEDDEPLSTTERAQIQTVRQTIEQSAQAYDRGCRHLVEAMRLVAQARASDWIARDAAIRYLYRSFHPPIPPLFIAHAFCLTEREVVIIAAGSPATAPPEWLQRLLEAVDLYINPDQLSS